MKKIIFITGNKHKLEIAKTVLNQHNIDVKNINLEVE